MALEALSTRQYLGWTLHELTQVAQHSAKIPLSGGEALIDFGIKHDLRPVHVIKNGGEEIINYSASLMDEEKPYNVEWYGLKCALVKKGDTIKLMTQDEI